MGPSDRFETMSEEMAAVLRAKTPGERLEIAAGMWRFARSLVLGAVEEDHPEWDDSRIQREASRRLSHGAV
jgi:hypothetical protein